MKRKILPLSLSLITMLLAVLIVSFSSHQSDSKYAPRKIDESSLVYGIKPASAYLAAIRNNQITGVIAPSDVNMVNNQLKKFTSSRSSHELTWNQLGPDNFGGRTRAIMFDNSDASGSTVYAAGVTGGIWKSTNVGTSWYKINSPTYNLYVTCMKQNSNGTIFAGTGESFAAETVSGLEELGFSSGFMGQGIFKSTDGENFTLIPSTQPQLNDDESEWAFVNEIAVDLNSGRLYAATNTGLKYSDDEGSTWMTPNYSYDTLYTIVNIQYDIKCDSFDIVSGNVTLYGPDTLAVLYDTTKKTTISTIYELVGNATDVQVNSDGDVVVSIDNRCYVYNQSGDVFKNVSTLPVNDDIMHNDTVFSTFNIQPLNGQSDTTYNKTEGSWGLFEDPNHSKLPSSGIGRLEFAFAPSNANVLYASAVNTLGNLYGVYRSDDKGVNWRVIMPSSTANPVFLGQGIYDNALTVFPENPDRVLLGGINAWEGVKVLETGYFSWKTISSSFFPTFSSSYLHADHHTYVFRPGTTNSFMVGTDGGVSIGVAESDGYSFQVSNRSYFTTQFYSIGVSGDSKFVTGGSQDNGTILITGNGNTDKQGEEIRAGDGCATVISKINKDIMVVSRPGGDGTFMFRSEDAGVNYSNQFLGGTSLANDAFYTPIALWESFDNQNSRDSVVYHAKQAIPGGTTIQVTSKNSNQPFSYTTPSDVNLQPGDSLAIKDIVSSRFFIASKNTVYMTSELHQFGKTPEWFEISNSSTGLLGTPQSIAYSSDANHVFVGMRDGRLYRVSNLALAYNYERADVSSPECIVSTQEIMLTAPGTGDPISQVVTSIAVDQTDPSRVLVTLGNYGNEVYVMYSDNALDQNPVFTSRQGNLPQMPVYSSVLEMTTPEMAIIGTEYGIFTTDDITQSSTVWERQDSLMGSVPVFQLKQQTVSKTSDTVTLINGNEVIKIVYPGTNNYGVIYAATFGRGLLRCNVFKKPVGIDEDVTQVGASYKQIDVYPNPVSDNATLEFVSETSNMANLLIFDLNGRKVKDMSITVQKGINNISINVSDLKSGSYVIQLVNGSNIHTAKIVAN